jgi:membrane associated rhomboid family serine protease
MQRRLYDALVFPVALVALMTIVEGSKHWGSGALDPYFAWGLFPRSVPGLVGILTAPLIHGGWEHLFSNSGPLLVLFAITLYFYHRVAFGATILVWLGSGFLVWLFAFQSNASHIGSSGVVYGLAAFVAGSGVFRKGNLRATALALMVVVSYSGMFWSLWRQEEGISWEYHFFGALMGAWAAWLFRGVAENYEDPVPVRTVRPAAEPRLFLPPDVFEKTKRERLEEAERERLLRELAAAQPSDAPSVEPPRPLTPWEWYIQQKEREKDLF